MKKTMVVLAGLLAGGGSCWGLGSDNIIQLNNTVRFSYQDNYYNTPTNKTATGVFTEEPEVLLNLARENSYLGLHYRPSFSWYLDPAIDTRQTLQHALDANWNQTLSPRLSYTISEALRYADQPELRDRNNSSVFANQSYLENTLNGTMGLQLLEATRLDASGRYYLLRYKEEAISTNADYSIISGGLTLRQELSKATTVNGSFNYDNTSYRQYSARSANTFSIGGGVDHTFGPRLLGSLSGGYQAKSFNLASINGQNSPYGNVSVTYLFDPRLRLTAGASYSLWEADIASYASQERFSSYGSLGYDISARVSFFLTGGMTHGKYLQDQSVVANGNPTAVPFTTGGADDIYQAGARLSYQIDRRNWVDVGYGYTKVSSDVRPDFDQNTYDVSWRISF